MILTDQESFDRVGFEIFKALDKDGSGTISLNEIKAHMNTTSLKMDDQTFKEVFSELD